MMKAENDDLQSRKANADYCKKYYEKKKRELAEAKYDKSVINR